MSTLCKLEIRGIRSFGVDNSQKLKFHLPLTLIVGQNGCGKTTIIECIKYALTGEFPPGTNSGKLFVHDPNIFNAVECLGQVKIMIKDYLGHKVTCTRSMKVIPQKGKTKFTSLDGTITYEGKDGRPTTITKRIAEINTEMCDFMGVSKAIINNVLFCHQDDSNWPLDEGKKLKEKFDAIFGTTEYNRAIERFIKLAKVYGDRQKEKQGDLKLLLHLKEAASLKNQEINEKERKLSKLVKDFEELSNSEMPIKIRLQEIFKLMQNISTLNGKKIEIETKYVPMHVLK